MAERVGVLMVVEAWIAPETWSGPAIVEDAEEMKPPYKLERFATDNVEDAETGAETWSEPAIVEEPTEIKRPDKVERPDTDKEEFKTAVPATVKVELADNGPATFKFALIVDEALEINPERLAKPPTVTIEEAEKFSRSER